MPEGKMFKIGLATYRPKTESSVPRSVTQRILEKVKFPVIPQTPSSVVEDFIIDQLNRGGLQEEGVVNNFFSDQIPEKIDRVFGKARKILSEVDWREIISDADIEVIREEIVSELESLGVPSGEIDRLRAIEIVFTEKGGVSTVDDSTVRVDKLQVTRKAMDCHCVDGSISINDSMRALTINVVAHELGHQVQRITNAGYGLESEWEDEVTSERFAEGWAWEVTNKDDRNAEIVKKSRTFQVAKVNQLWQAIKGANVDLRKIFNGIIKRVDPKYKDFIEARYGLYGMNAPENYALPYNFELIKDEIRKAQTS